MIRDWSNLRYVLPVLLTSTISFALCTSMAILLLQEQSTSAEAVGKKITAWRATSELEEGLTDLCELLRDRVEGVASLNDRTLIHIESVTKISLDPWSGRQIQRIKIGFQNYLKKWDELNSTPPSKHEPILDDSLRILETTVLPLCDEYHQRNTQGIEETEQNHQAVVQGLAWGLAGMGSTAAIAGVFLGYAFARGLRRSIKGLQIHIQNAADKLDPKIPTIEFTPDLSQLDYQMQSLIHQIEQTVEKLQQREREVLRAEQLAAVGQLAAGVAHEIRNPLTSIKMLVQSGIETATREPMLVEDLQVIEREIRRMENSLQHFLDFARRPKLHKKITDPAQLIEQTLELLRGRTQKQRVEVTFRPSLPELRLSADSEQLQQVLVNLILNSLDVLPHGGKVLIDLQILGEHLIIEVQDSGPGIPAEMKDKLFRPFMSTKETGLGLGLVISQRILEDHGGFIEMGKGSLGGACFRICLPIHPPHLEIENADIVGYR